MEKLIEQLSQSNFPIEAQFGAIKVTNSFSLKGCNSRFENLRFSGILLCCERHLQHLIDLGVKIDFTKGKRIGFSQNQKYIGSGLNTCAVSVKMDEKTFLKVNKFFRKDGTMDMMNDHDLARAGFIFKQKISVTDKNEKRVKHFERVALLRSQARTIKHQKRLPQTGYGFAQLTNHNQKVIA
jgi:hypothetical protein